MIEIVVVKPGLVRKKVAKTSAHANEKGGVGKTTTEYLQAYRLAEEGNRVLIVDVDAQRNMTKLALGSMAAVESVEKNGFTSDQLFRDDLDVNDIRVCKTVLHDNLHVLPSNKEKIAAVMAGGSAAVKMVKNPKRYIDQLDYDYIFIDTPPSIGVTQLAALHASDYLFVPVTVDDFSNEGFISLLKSVQTVKKDLRSKVQLAAVYLTFYQKPSERKGENPYKEIEAQIRRDYKDYLVEGHIPESKSIKEARMAGRACWVNAPNGNAALVGRKVRSLVDLLNARIV